MSTIGRGAGAPQTQPPSIPTTSIERERTSTTTAPTQRAAETTQTAPTSAAPPLPGHIADGRRAAHQLEGQLREARLRTVDTPTQESTPRLATHLPNERSVGAQRLHGHVITPDSRSPIPEEQWSRPSSIVSQLTQNTADSPNGTTRCGPSALLGGALMNGSGPAAASIEGTSHGASTLSRPERSELRQIAGRVREHSASFRDLNRAQDLMHRAADTHRSIGPELESRIHELEQTRQTTSHPSIRQSIDATYQRLQEINDRNQRGEATQEDVQRLNELLRQQAPEGAQIALIPNPRDPHRHELQWQVHTDGRRSDSGIDDGELSTLARRSFGWQQTRNPDSIGDRPLDTMLFGRGANRLQSGQSATLSVPGQPGDPAAHYITVGRDRDGNAFIYNPDPSAHDHTLVTGDRAVRQTLQRYESRDGLATDAQSQLPQVIITNPGGIPSQ